jgi:(1->4)-alpha-D-glucan 1-alpha-D-glucosylmutase
VAGHRRGAPRRGAPAAAGANAGVADLLDDWPDGRIKLYLTAVGLGVRRDHHPLFLEGDYEGLVASGPTAPHVLAFARRLRGRCAIAVVPRLTVALGADRAWPIGERVWTEVRLRLPDGAPDTYREVFTGRTLRAAGDTLSVAEIFADCPVALLLGGRERPA